MEPVVNFEVRELCRAVSEENDPQRVKTLLDALTQVLDERQLAAALF